MTSARTFDVLIIGGGPSGLSVAVALARQAYTTLILDSCTYRNASVKHMHNFPGFDHADPAQFRGKILDDLKQRYGSIDRKVATIESVRRLDSGIFETIDEQGSRYQGRKLVLATGVRDRLEDEVPGYADCWGRGVFHCLFCHGYEERDAESAGVLVGGNNTAPETVMHVAKMAKRLSNRVTIYTHASADIAASLRDLIHSSKISVDTRRIASFSLIGNGPRVKMAFEDGSTAVEGFVASHPKVEQHAEHLVQQLGLDKSPTGEILVQPPFNATNLPGCFAVGDAATPFRSVVAAVNAGTFAGVGIAGQLQSELEEQDLL